MQDFEHELKARHSRLLDEAAADRAWRLIPRQPSSVRVRLAEWLRRVAAHLNNTPSAPSPVPCCAAGK